MSAHTAVCSPIQLFLLLLSQRTKHLSRYFIESHTGDTSTEYEELLDLDLVNHSLIIELDS